MKPSKPMSLNSQDWSKWTKDVIFFLLVPLTFYFGGVLGVLNESGHVLTLKDFIPSNATNIAIVTYVLNQILNLARKYVA